MRAFGYDSSIRVLTPRGFIALLELEDRDEVITDRNEHVPIRIVGRYDSTDNVRVIMGSGRSFVCGADTELEILCGPRFIKTLRPPTDAELGLRLMPAKFLLLRKFHYNNTFAKPIGDIDLPELSTAERLLSPYVVGALINTGYLGNKIDISGSIDALKRIITELPERVSVKIEKRTGSSEHMYTLHLLREHERAATSNIRRLIYKLGLSGQIRQIREIPEQYLWTSFANRCTLMKGMFDVGGYDGNHLCDPDRQSTAFTRTLTLSSANIRMTEQLTFLFLSMGAEVSVRGVPATDRNSSDQYATVTGRFKDIRTYLNIFKSKYDAATYTIYSLNFKLKVVSAKWIGERYNLTRYSLPTEGRLLTDTFLPLL